MRVANQPRRFPSDDETSVAAQPSVTHVTHAVATPPTEGDPQPQHAELPLGVTARVQPPVEVLRFDMQWPTLLRRLVDESTDHAASNQHRTALLQLAAARARATHGGPVVATFSRLRSGDAELRQWLAVHGAPARGEMERLIAGSHDGAVVDALRMWLRDLVSAMDSQDVAGPATH